jgi:hypothetical protein
MTFTSGLPGRPSIWLVRPARLAIITVERRTDVDPGYWPAAV